jgi:hypothetical protein
MKRRRQNLLTIQIPLFLTSIAVLLTTAVFLYPYAAGRLPWLVRLLTPDIVYLGGIALGYLFFVFLLAVIGVVVLFILSIYKGWDIAGK